MKKMLAAVLLSAAFVSCQQHPVADQVVFGNVWTGVMSNLPGPRLLLLQVIPLYQ